MHRFRNTLLFRLFLSGLGALLLASLVTAAGETNTSPAKTATATKIEAGPRPPGKIAFIKDGGIWIMDTDGKNRMSVCGVTNAQGRLSFSPDNKRIAFSRKGQDTNQLPSDEGGAHTLHDIFIAFVDSAKTNPSWWRRGSYSLGGFFPEWSDNDSVVYFQNDLNAGFVDYIVPSHQLAKVDINDGHAEYFRKDWQTLKTNMTIPTFTRDGKKIAYAISYSLDAEKFNFQNFGVKIVDAANIMAAESEMRKPSAGLEKATAPQWSPDGRWLAYINNDMRDPGIYIVKADLSEKRLVFAPNITQQLLPHPVGWSPNSKWLAFATADGVIYLIDINGDNLTPISGPGKHSNPAWSR